MRDANVTNALSRRLSPRPFMPQPPTATQHPQVNGRGLFSGFKMSSPTAEAVARAPLDSFSSTSPLCTGNLADHIQEFYQNRAPSELTRANPVVPSKIAAKYQGRESELYARLLKKYPTAVPATTTAAAPVRTSSFIPACAPVCYAPGCAPRDMRRCYAIACPHKLQSPH